MTKTYNSIIAALVCLVLTLGVQAQTYVLTVSPTDKYLRRVDTSTFQTVDSILMTYPGSFSNFSGISQHSITLDYFVSYDRSGLEGSYGKVNLDGKVEFAGFLGDECNSSTFNPIDTSVALMVGDQGTGPNRMHFGKADGGGTSLFKQLDATTGDGEAIGYDTDNDMFYRITGVGSVKKAFSIDPSTGTETQITINTSAFGTATALMYLGAGNFVMTDNNKNVFIFQTTGLIIPLGKSTQHIVKGMAEISCSNNIIPTGPTTFCDGEGVFLLASNNSTSYQWYKNGVLLPNDTLRAIRAETSGVYNCFINNPICSVNDSASTGITVTVNPLPATSISPVGPFSGSAGDSFVVCASGAGAGMTFQWYKNGVAITGATDTCFTIKETGDYNVEINDGTCADTASSSVSATFPTGINDILATSVNIYPNPFNHATSIKLSSARNAKFAEVLVYNNLGSVVRVLHQGSLNAGNHSFNWDGSNEVGSSLQSGLYFIVLNIDGQNSAHKVFLSK